MLSVPANDRSKTTGSTPEDSAAELSGSAKVTTGIGASTTSRESAKVELPALFVAVKVNVVRGVATVGVPVISPVEESRVSPAGRVGATV